MTPWASQQSGAVSCGRRHDEKGLANAAIDTVWKHIPQEGQPQKIKGVTINAADLLPPGKTYFGYAGSLTTPPCDEGVQWNVMAEPIKVSAAQIAKFESLFQVIPIPLQDDLY